MVTDPPVCSTALWKRLIMGAAVFFLFSGLSGAQEQVVYWPDEQNAVEEPKETIFWRTLALDFKQRMAKNSLDKDIKISFLNTPYGKHRVEDLIAYTLSGNGAVTVQMKDTLKKISVSPQELYWMGQFLFDYRFEDLPETEPDDQESAEFRISLIIGDRRKTLRLYNSRNNKDREIVWQYLYAFGQRLLQSSGLSDQNKPILPVCRGITGVQELDTDDDGRVDWLKLKVEFYAFKSGDFTIGFCGRRTSLFLSQGNSTHYLYINAYYLKNPDPSYYDYSNITVNMKPPLLTGAYVFDVAGDTAAYAARPDIRQTPDLSGTGAGSRTFRLKMNQEVIIEMGRDGKPDDRSVIRFALKEVTEDYAVIGNETESIVVSELDPFFLHDIECMGCVLSFVRSEGGAAIFDVNWIVPEKQVIENKIQHFNEAFASEHYHGDKEQARQSLDTALSCKEAIENAHLLRVNIIYASPE